MLFIFCVATDIQNVIKCSGKTTSFTIQSEESFRKVDWNDIISITERKIVPSNFLQSN